MKSSGIQVVPCGHTDGRKNATKLTVAFRDFANVPKNKASFLSTRCLYGPPYSLHEP